MFSKELMEIFDNNGITWKHGIKKHIDAMGNNDNLMKVSTDDGDTIMKARMGLNNRIVSLFTPKLCYARKEPLLNHKLVRREVEMKSEMNKAGNSPVIKG